MEIKDLTGQRFGRLTVIRQTDERRGGYIVWECMCDCGNTALVSGDRLKSGRTKSCGCAKTVDLTGQRFGQLTVIRPTEERYFGRVVWECICDCGKTAFVDASNLRTGVTTSCGCARGKEPLDITGRRFGWLTAVRMTDERHNGSVVWECRCDCGNTTFVTVSRLCSGHTQSCGCMKPGKEAADLTGQRFGQLTAVRKTDKRHKGDKGSVIWECKCDCGNITYVPAHSLQAGGKKSCGCVKSGKRPLDLTGHRFGWLTAVEPTEKRMYSNVIWKCKCDCGNISFVSAHNLRSGGTQSCGCSKSTKARGAGEEEEKTL